MALEDATRRHQRPKVDFYDDFLFLVFYALCSPQPGESLRPDELSLFIGRNYVVTVHDDELPVLDDTRDRWRQNAQAVGRHDIGMLVYSILDAVVDGYFPIVDEFSQHVEALEEMVLDRWNRTPWSISKMSLTTFCASPTRSTPTAISSPAPSMPTSPRRRTG